MSVDTGEILDAEIISKTCEVCDRCCLDKTSKEFETRKTEHVKSGKCLSKYEGSSTGMETAAAKKIWSRLISKHKLRYTKILCDGDNKTLQALNEMQVYGSDTSIEKLECVNHVHKRMGIGLRNLVKKSHHVKGGSGGLTANMIDKMSSYYRNHIMSHVTTSKDPDDVDAAVKKMQTNIIASLYQYYEKKINQ